MPEKCEVLEELRWSPGVPDCDLMMYLRAARSMAAFAGMCDGGSAEDGCVAASRDDTTINAMDLLHESSYDTGKALQALVKNPIPPGIEKKWVEEEQKRFVKGLRQYGKNFFKIRKELLPHKETADLVEFYYLWKKSPGAVTSRTHRRNRRQNTLRRIKPSPIKQNRPTSNDYILSAVDASSGSDEGEDSEDSDSRDVTGYTCQNCCTTTSKDWLPVGKDLAVMCTECRLYYKKHGELRPVDSKDSLPFLFQPVKDEDSLNGKHVMRTRRSKECQSPKTVSNDTNASGIKAGRKSPGVASNGSSGILDRDKKRKQIQDIPLKSKKRIKEEKISPEDDEDKSGSLKKKNRSDSPSESVCTESSISNEDAAPDGETPSSPSPSASPSPSPAPLLPQLPSVDEPEAEIPIESTATNVEEVDVNITIKEEFIPPETSEAVICPVEIKQEVITNDIEESSENVETNEPHPEPLEMVDKIKEEVTGPSYTPSPVPSPISYCPPIEEPAASAEESGPDPSQYPSPSVEQPLEEKPAISNPSQYMESPQNIKLEPVDVASSPPPPPPVHEPVHHPHVYASSLPTSSQAHFSNSISMSMTNSSVTGSISASSSISLSYHNHSKMPYSGHSTLIATSQSSMSAFNYRPFSPQYPYAPALPPFPHMPPQPMKHKYNSGTPSHSPSNTHTPPPTSSPYSSAPLALPQSYRESPPPTKSHGHNNESSTSFSRTTQSTSSTMQSSPVTSHSSVPHQATSHSSSKSPLSYSIQNQNAVNQKSMPQPAHQSSLYPQVGLSQQAPVKSSSHSHQLPRPHPLSQLHSSTGLPTPSQHLPPTTYVANLPPQVPLSQNQMHASSERQESEKCSVIQEPVTIEEEEETETHFPFRGPSPEPRVEDTECHRSQSAIFLRHWNRGEFNSCARTDLTFKPVPESKLARKREERARKAAEKEREETKARLGSTPDSKPGSSSQGDGHHLSPFDRHVQRNGPDTPALRQLSEYARPHAAAFPPGYGRPPQAGPMGVLPHGIDPILHYQLTSGMYGAAARESYRLEMEMEKRERDMHFDKLKAEYEMKAARTYDHPHWIELQRRYGGLQGGPSVGLAPAHAGMNHGPFGLYSAAERERLGIPSVPVSEAAAIDRMNAERAHNERLMLGTDPLLRLQMAGLAPELHTHAHTHAHAHTHLHLHPHDAVSAAAAAAAAMGHPGMEPGVHPSPGSHPLLPPTGYAGGGQRPGMVPRAELLHQAASGMLRPPYDEQFAHQITAQIHQEQIQRQILMERERYAHMGGPVPHPSPLISQHEEFLRQQQQREREIKLRSLEEAARGGRPPMN